MDDIKWKTPTAQLQRSVMMIIWDGIFSGCCAAIGAVFGKLAFGDDDLLNVIGRYYYQPIDFRFVYFFRAIAGVTMFTLNLYMVHFFVKALSSAGTLFGTLLSTTVNIILASLLGHLVFGEALTIRWGIGTAIAIVGIALVLSSQKKEKND